MAKLPPEEIEKIVEDELPGYTVERSAPTDAPTRHAEADEASPGIDELRKRYGVEPDVESHSGPEPEPDSAEEDPDDEIVAVRPKDARDPWDHDARPKSVVISGKDRKIVGGQG